MECFLASVPEKEYLQRCFSTAARLCRNSREINFMTRNQIIVAVVAFVLVLAYFTADNKNEVGLVLFIRSQPHLHTQKGKNT